MKHLSAEQVLFIHSRIVDETGGSHGIIDLGLLESAVARPRATFRGKDLYPTLFHKAAALMESLIKSHPFVDGNKRTAITSAGIFLQMNGHMLQASQREVVDFTMALATKKAEFEHVVEWFMKHSSKR